MYVYYVCKHWYMDDLNRTDRYNDIRPFGVIIVSSRVKRAE